MVRRGQDGFCGVQALVDEAHVADGADVVGEDALGDLHGGGGWVWGGGVGGVVGRGEGAEDGGLEGEGVDVQAEVVVGHEEAGFERWRAGQCAPYALPPVDGGAEVIDEFDVASAHVGAEARSRVGIQHVVDIAEELRELQVGLAVYTC